MSISDVLSHDEVELLLNKADSGNPMTSKECRDFDPYDFSKSSNRHLYGLSKLELINDIFCRDACENIGHFICKRITIEGSTPQIMTFDEHIKSLEKPILVNLIGIKPLSSIMLISFSNEFTTRSLEILLGGDVKNPLPKDREFGKTEIKICRLIVDILNKCLANSWSIITPLEFNFLKTSTNLNLVNIAQEDENVIVMKYNLIVADTQSEFTICIPIESLSPIKNLLNTDSHESVNDPEAETCTANLKVNVQNTALKMKSILTETQINVAELLKLDIGDIINIDPPQGCFLTSGGSKVFKGKPGIHHGIRAMKIEDFYDEQ